MSIPEEGPIAPGDSETVDKEPPKKRNKSIREKIDENDGAAVGIKNISAIRSKIRRNQEWVRLKKEKKKEKRKRQDDRKKVRFVKNCRDCYLSFQASLQLKNETNGPFLLVFAGLKKFYLT